MYRAIMTGLFMAIMALLASLVGAASTNDWKTRSIYFALTDRIARSSTDNGGPPCGDLGAYCGGTFQGLQGKLDYIKGMGFDAIWITPVIKNADGGYHGYWARDLYAINPNFGSAQDLKSLVNAAHDKNMFVMVDVVANHVGPGSVTSNNPSLLSHEASYHVPCAIDYSNQTSVENCRIANLPDVHTQDASIRKLYQDWIHWLVGEFSFDGVRIDTVKHVEHDFWSNFSAAAGVYTIGEAWHQDPSYVASYAKSMSGLLNYPIYGPLNDFFQQKGSSQALVDMHNQIGALFPDPAALGTFLDNHDNARFLDQKNDTSLLKNALTYVLLGRGIPILYYGTEQGYAGGSDPAQRQDLWRSDFKPTDLSSFIAKLLSVKRSLGGLSGNDHAHLLVEATGYAFSRAADGLIALTSNIGVGQAREYCIWTRKPNESWKSVFDGKTYTADSSADGHLCVTVQNGEPVILVS